MARRLQLSSWCLSTREAAGLPVLLCGVRTAWFCQPKGREFPVLQPHFSCFQALSSLSFCKFLPGLLSGWFCWQNTASGSLPLPVQQWQLHLRRCPWLCLLALSQSHILAVILWRFETGLFLGQQGYHPGVPSSFLMIPLCTTSLTFLPSRFCCIDFLSKACPEGQLSFSQDTERACVSRTINIFLEMINELPINWGSCQIHLRNRPSDPICPCLVYSCVWKLLGCKQRANQSEAAT